MNEKESNVKSTTEQDLDIRTEISQKEDGGNRSSNVSGNFTKDAVSAFELKLVKKHE